MLFWEHTLQSWDIKHIQKGEQTLETILISYSDHHLIPKKSPEYSHYQGLLLFEETLLLHQQVERTFRA